MKKRILFGLLSLVALQGFGFAKTITPNGGMLKRASLQATFNDYGLDAERNFFLISERLGLQDWGVNSFVATKIYKALRQFDPSKLVHKKCIIGEYQPLGTNFYAWIGTVKPFFNTIESYQIQGKDGVRSKVFTFGVSDIDTQDNCNNEYVGKDDKPAQCARRMWSYFGSNTFKIVSCKS